ncbi:VPA1262 family protein [Neisseriaceae bacterium ESL0693]|nr:VPA1262 family protein [Neisseriaceae bacterium ESL0693]
MEPTLDEILNDYRLARLFSTEARPCALQLWILQIKYNSQLTENRLVYGRLLPYRHVNRKWSFNDNDKYAAIEQVKAKIIRLNLYISSSDCADLLRQLSSGQSISSINKTMGFECSDKFSKQFGHIILTPNNLTYRPVAYLLNRDVYNYETLTSPHQKAGALSASIIQINKNALFLLNGKHNTDLTTFIAKQLNAETDLNFNNVDITRFGDLELLVFPTLNDNEQNLLNVEWPNPTSVLTILFNPVQVPYFEKFQFYLKIINNRQIFCSMIGLANRKDDGIFKYEFQLPKKLWARKNAIEVEIFGYRNDCPHESILCCRWREAYVRGICSQITVIGNATKPNKFDWLEKTTKPTLHNRVKNALTPAHDSLRIENYIGSRIADPWVPINNELIYLFEQLHPPESKGNFFQRWNTGDGVGDGRLQFVEWFKALLEKYRQHQIIIFDPYFDDIGVQLLLMHQEEESNYIVFTSDRDNNTLEKYLEDNRHLLSRINLRIYYLKKGKLHDRYILVIGSDGFWKIGFHLSNSLQKTAENYPLLITPIPADVLLKIEPYKLALVRQALAAHSDSQNKNSYKKPFFDSTTFPTTYNRLQFLEKPEAGNVLSVWTGETSLKGLNGNQLREQMKVLGFLKNNSLTLPNGLHNCINKQAINSKDFHAIWEILSEILKHFPKEPNIKFERDFLEFLNHFLIASFDRKHDKNTDKGLVIENIQLFRERIETLLGEPIDINHLIPSKDHTVFIWSEFYAIEILWKHAPDSLLSIIELQISSLPTKPNANLSLLGRIIQQIACSIQSGINKTQLDLLVHSNQDLLQWIGFHAIRQQLDIPNSLDSVLLFLEDFPYQTQLKILCWMIRHTATDTKKKDLYKNTGIYEGLIVALHKILPAKIDIEALRDLVDFLKGNQHLTLTEPWLFYDVISPLLQNSHITSEDALDIWMNAFINRLELPENKNLYFNQVYEGNTIKITSFLFAKSSSKQKEFQLQKINKILKQNRMIVQQPLAGASNSTHWNNAFKIFLWILAFSKSSKLQLHFRKMIDHHLENLLQDVRNLTMTGPWEKDQLDYKELIEFLRQIDNLLEKHIGKSSLGT